MTGAKAAIGLVRWADHEELKETSSSALSMLIHKPEVVATLTNLRYRCRSDCSRGGSFGDDDVAELERLKTELDQGAC